MSYRKVMFSVVCVCVCVCVSVQGEPRDHYPYWNSLYKYPPSTLNVTGRDSLTTCPPVNGPLPPPNMETCSNLFTSAPHWS